jgi:hypothetical protein
MPATRRGKGTSALNSYVDSTKQVTRVTFEMVDAGSKKMNVVLAELQPRIDSIFNPKKFHVELTGSSIIFIKAPITCLLTCMKVWPGPFS